MSRTVLVEAELSLKESTEGATEQALAPASTTLKPDKLAILQEARDQAVRQGLSLEARAESWVPIEAADQLGGGLKEILRAMHSTWEPLTEMREMMQRQHDLLLGVGALSALGSAAGGMGGFVSAAGDIGALGRQSEIRALGINSAEMLRAFMPPSAYLETEREMARAVLRSIADFGSLDKLSRSFIPDIEPFRSAWPAPSTRAPAVPHAPEPPAAEIAEVHLPGERWAEVITVAIRGGKATKAAMIKLIMSLPDDEKSAPGVKPALLEEIEEVGRLYKEYGYGKTQSAFCMFLDRKGLSMSVETLQDRLKLYEALTGEKIRPGRGRRPEGRGGRKRKQM